MSKPLLSPPQERILQQLVDNPGSRLYYTAIRTYIERPGQPVSTQQPGSARKVVEHGFVEAVGQGYYVLSEAGKRYMNSVMEAA